MSGVGEQFGLENEELKLEEEELKLEEEELRVEDTMMGQYYSGTWNLNNVRQHPYHLGPKPGAAPPGPPRGAVTAPSSAPPSLRGPLNFYGRNDIPTKPEISFDTAPPPQPGSIDIKPDGMTAFGRKIGLKNAEQQKEFEITVDLVNKIEHMTGYAWDLSKGNTASAFTRIHEGDTSKMTSVSNGLYNFILKVRGRNPKAFDALLKSLGSSIPKGPIMTEEDKAFSDAMFAQKD